MKNIHFKNLGINIKCGELVSIIGPNGCGKTVLLKMISGRVKNDFIYIDNKNINEYNLNYKRNNIVCVINDNIYNTEIPNDELKYYLKILNLSDNEIKSRVDYFIEYFSLDELVNTNFIYLRTDERIYIKILSLLIINPFVFCIDDLLTYLSLDKKNKVLNYIKDRNITFLSVTSNMEELLLFDKVLVMNKGKKELFGKTLDVLNREDMFSELGLSLPFIYDINSLLKSYDLVDSNHIIYKELVDILWK